MKKLFLIISSIILSFGLSTAWATVCENGQKLCGKACIPSGDTCWNCAKTENDVCGAYLTDTTVEGKKKLNISGTGEMTDWADYAVTPWFSSRHNITELDISPDITSVGDWAYTNFSDITGTLTIPESATRIGTGAFAKMPGITGTLTIPDSVASIGHSAFYGMTGVTGALVIPDSVTSIGWSAFGSMTGVTELVIPDSWSDEGYTLDNRMFYHSCFANIDSPTGTDSCNNAKIVCQGETDKCYKALAKFFANGDPNCPTNVTCNCTNDSCISSSRIVSVAEAVENGSNHNDLCTGMYEWNGSACVRKGEFACNDTKNHYFNGNTCTRTPADGKISCVNPSYKENDGYCDRVRYTPAEAAAVLKDTDNELIMTFKVNR